MKIVLAPFAPQIAKEKQWMLEGCKAYTDPFSLGRNIRDKLDVLPLLVDRVFVNEPSAENLKSWKYDRYRFFALVQERMFVPIYVSEEPEEIYGGGNFLVRKQILADSEFSPIYERSVEEDANDDEFVNIAQEISTKNETIEDLSFNLCWDLIISQMLIAPITIGGRFEKLLEYKIKASIRDLSSISESANYVALGDTVSKFLYRILEKLPSSLDVDELKNFRRDKVARKFRQWLENEFLRAKQAKKVAGARIDEKMQQDFLELAESYSKTTSRISWILSCSVGIAAGVYSGPFAGVGAAISSILPKAVASSWKRYGRNNWAYLVLRMRRMP